MIARKKDFLSSIFWGGVGLAFGLGGIRLGLGSLHTPGPGFIPAIMGGVLLLLSVVLLLTVFLSRTGEQEKFTFWKEQGSWRTILYSFLALLGYIIFLDPLGYLLATFFFLLYLLKFISGKKLWLALGVALLTSAMSYLLFAVGLGVSLPHGMIRFR
jgi:putative tricarboxylic transport membrane protein